jgi:hypothetical protein
MTYQTPILMAAGSTLERVRNSADPEVDNVEFPGQPGIAMGFVAGLDD